MNSHHPYMVALPLIIGFGLLGFLRLEALLPWIALLFPFLMLALVLWWFIQKKTLKPKQLWFLLASGLIGIFVVLLPGIHAARDVAHIPTDGVWVFLGGLTLISLGLAIGAAYLIVLFLWLDP